MLPLQRLSFVGPSTLFAAFAVWVGVAHAQTPRLDYMLHCQGCHLEDGAGTEGKIPGLKDFVGKFLHVPGGREYLVQVPGVASSSLDDEALAEVLNWMLVNLSPNETPPDFEPYTAEEVAGLRVPLASPHEVRERLLEEYEARKAR